MSLDKYVYDNLVTTEGLSVDYEGKPFDNESADEWVQSRIFFPTTDFHRQGSSTEYADNVDIMLNMNIFVKKSGITISHRHYALRDIVANYFRVGQNIEIKNYAESGSTHITYVKVREDITDSPLPETNEYYQYNLTKVIQWTRLTPKV